MKHSIYSKDNEKNVLSWFIAHIFDQWRKNKWHTGLLLPS